MNNSTFNYALYQVRLINKDDATQYGAYLELLQATYSPLGFFHASVLPKKHSQCFGLFFCGILEGIFAVTPLNQSSNIPYTTLIPEISESKHLAELSNVVLRKRVRGAVALGVMLYEAAKYAVSSKFDALVGTTRQQTLPFFVDFGVTPVFHEPLHLMGNEAINDFVIYFNTVDEESVQYMHARARRIFKKEVVMANIRQNFARDRSGKFPLTSSESIETIHAES